MGSSLIRILIVLCLLAIPTWYFGQKAYKNNIVIPLEEKSNAIDMQKQAIANLKKIAEQVPGETQTLDAYNQRSLPNNLNVARLHYQTWLIQLADYAELQDPVIEVDQPVNNRNMFYTFSCNVRGRGGLDQITRFLFEFYSARTIHRIDMINIVPVRGKGRSLADFSIRIQAMLLPGADRDDRLPSGTYQRLATSYFDTYDLIADRDLMAVKLIRTRVDPADQSYVTAINKVNGQPEAWIMIRTEDRILKVYEGDQLEVGGFSGRVLDIVGQDMIVNVDGQRWLLTIGEPITHGFALPPEM